MWKADKRLRCPPRLKRTDAKSTIVSTGERIIKTKRTDRPIKRESPKTLRFAKARCGGDPCGVLQEGRNRRAFRPGRNQRQAVQSSVRRLFSRVFPERMSRTRRYPVFRFDRTSTRQWEESHQTLFSIRFRRVKSPYRRKY